MWKYTGEKDNMKINFLHKQKNFINKDIVHQLTNHSKRTYDLIPLKAVSMSEPSNCLLVDD